MHRLIYLIAVVLTMSATSGCKTDVEVKRDKAKELQITATLTIHEGKLAEFKEIAASCLQIVLEKDKGTRQYDWFFSEDKTKCVVREMYNDSDALLQHIANLGETFGALLSVSDLSVEVYGSPSPELIKATEGIDTVVFSYLQGL